MKIQGKKLSLIVAVLGVGALVYSAAPSKSAQEVCDPKMPDLEQVYNNARKNGNVASMMWALREGLKQNMKFSKDLINLCTINVTGSDSLFCQKNKNITRIKMPQLSGKPSVGSPADIILHSKDMNALRVNNKDLEAVVRENFNKIALKDVSGEVDAAEYFKKYLQKKGLTITRTQIPAAKLQATQSELVPDKINSMWWALEVGSCNKYYAGIVAPIFVSKDNYVLDGHHRWAAVVANAFGRLKVDEVMMDVFQVNENIGDTNSGLVKLANEFANDFGIAAKAG